MPHCFLLRNVVNAALFYWEMWNTPFYGKCGIHHFYRKCVYTALFTGNVVYTALFYRKCRIHHFYRKCRIHHFYRKCGWCRTVLQKMCLMPHCFTGKMGWHHFYRKDGMTPLYRKCGIDRTVLQEMWHWPHCFTGKAALHHFLVRRCTTFDEEMHHFRHFFAPLFVTFRWVWSHPRQNVTNFSGKKPIFWFTSLKIGRFSSIFHFFSKKWLFSSKSGYFHFYNF